MLIIKPITNKEVVIRVPASSEEQVIRIRTIDRSKPCGDSMERIERVMGFACARRIGIKHEPIDQPAGVAPSGHAPDARSDPMARKDPKPTPKKPADDELQDEREPDGIDTNNRDG